MYVKKVLVFLLLFNFMILTRSLGRQPVLDAKSGSNNPFNSVQAVTKLEVLMVTITFDSNGGSPIDSLTLTTGSPFNAPFPPTKPGFAFGGWFLDDGIFLNQYLFTIVPEVNLSLHAKWIDLTEATMVDLLILEIPDIITISHTILIETARAAYEALSVELKPFVSQYGALLSAEETLDDLQDQVTKVIRMIDNLTCPISYVDRDSVFAARDAYEALAPDQKERVTNYVSLWDAERRIIALEAEAQAVVDMIDVLSETVSLGDASAISEARSAYDALTVCQQSYVQNYYVLADAEDQLALLRDVVEISELILLIDELPSVITSEDSEAVLYAASLYRLMYLWQKEQIINYGILAAAEATTSDIFQADAFMMLVEALPVLIEMHHQSQIDALDVLYQTFDAAVLGYVEGNSIATFEAAKSRIDDLKKAQVVIDQIASLTETDETGNEISVKASRNAYDSLTATQKSFVTNLDVLLAAEAVIPAPNAFQWEWLGLILALPLSVLVYVFRLKILKLFKK
jgi:uncharacterized repeat protein (TIGR02543 family)